MHELSEIEQVILTKRSAVELSGVDYGGLSLISGHIDIIFGDFGNEFLVLFSTERGAFA
jgi:hypothetical protein